MFDRDPLTAVVRLSKGEPLGQTMSKIRTWLASQQIHPTDFTTAADARGYTFTVGFRDTQDADRFRAQFGA